MADLETQQELFLKEMKKLGWRESAALSSQFQKLCFLIFLPGFSCALMLFGVILIPLGFLDHKFESLIVGVAVIGFFWVFLIAPYLCRKYAESYLRIRSEYLGRQNRGNSYAYICETKKLFFIWRHQYFFELHRIFRFARD